MKLRKLLLMAVTIFLLDSSGTTASAGDFDWMKELNIQARADLSGFKATLAARFKIGDAEVNAVFSNVPDPADAYMVLRLGEMSSKPGDYVVEQYRAGKDKGWGVLAKSLGIKPGSKEFKALKQGHDIPNDKAKSKVTGNGKGKNKGKK